MIRLTLMNEFFDRVDNERRSPIVDVIAERWFDGACVRVGPASSNFTAIVTEGESTFYLRFNHETERTAADYTAELRFVQHVVRHGVRAAEPVPSRTGRLVEGVPTELGVFHAVMFEAVPGAEVDLENLDEALFRTWGRTMATLHLAAEDYEGTDRPDWRDHLAFAEATIPEGETAAHTELRTVHGVLSELGQDRPSFGVIHFDAELDNIRWLDGEPGIFDFDDCARYWFVADVAYALRELYDDKIDRIELADPRLRNFVAGYRAVRALSEDELRLLAVFVRAHNLYWYARLQRSIADGAIPGEPQWTTDLRQRLSMVMDGLRDDFESHPLVPVR